MLNIYYTDAVNSCDCCGKTPLKYTVAIADAEHGEVVHLGSVCASHYTGYRMTGNPYRALERFAGRAQACGLTIDAIRESMALRQAEREM